jgi:hypothetical protein
MGVGAQLHLKPSEVANADGLIYLFWGSINLFVLGEQASSTALVARRARTLAAPAGALGGCPVASPRPNNASVSAWP